MSTSTSTTLSRDEVRSRIFAEENRELKKQVITFFGQQIEIRQPSFEDVIRYRDQVEGDDQAASILILINNSYVPGTKERVFEIGDYDMLISMPFGADMNRAMNAVMGVSNVADIENDAKNSDATH